MVCVYTTKTAAEAHLIAGYLRGFTYHAEVRNDGLAQSGVDGHRWIEVWVAHEHADAVQTLLDDVLRREDAGWLSLVPSEQRGGELSLTPDSGRLSLSLTHCPACDADWEPGFEVCWSCETPLSDESTS